MSLGEYLLPDNLVELPKGEFVPKWKFSSLKRDEFERIMGVTDESHGKGPALTKQEIFKRLVNSNIVSNSLWGKIKACLLIHSRLDRGTTDVYFQKVRDATGKTKYRIVEDYDPF